MTQATVYLLDDEPDMVEMLGDMVELAGLNARGYTRASHFFEQVTAFDKGSILVLDLHMPGMDGIEVMRRLAQMENPPALVLISGHDTGVLHAAEKLGRAHNLDILASLGKPVELDKFQQVLEQHIPGLSVRQHRDALVVERELTKEELHHAIYNEQLLLHYQP